VVNPSKESRKSPSSPPPKRLADVYSGAKVRAERGVLSLEIPPESGRVYTAGIN